MRSDITLDNGESSGLRSWPTILYALSASGSPLCAITSHQYARAAAFGAVRSKLSVHTVTPSKAAKRDTRRGKGVRKRSEHDCTSLPPSFVRFNNLKPKGHAHF